MSSIEVPWWQSGVIYQIYPRSFKDSNRDGIGDLQGIIAKIDYLQWLGVDALWLSPIYPSPMDDFGYDVSDYQGVDPCYGTLDDFDALLAEAKNHGMRVIMDLIPNHTSDRHPWFLESSGSVRNAKRDWYVWRDPAPGGGPPNNWISLFGGPAWTFDEKTKQYYLHTFLSCQPDLNWRNPDVRDAMYQIMTFWLERGVAGFRVDVIEYLMKDPLFRDEPPNPDYHPAHHIERLRNHAIYSVAHPEVHHIIKEMRTLVDSFGAVLIGEVSYQADIRRTVSYYGKNNDEAHLPFNFGLINETMDRASALRLREYINRYEDAVPPGCWPNNVLGNHDKPRYTTRFGPNSRLALMLALTLRGTPFIYYGDEIGMRDVDIPAEKLVDPFGVQEGGESRDTARAPMQWNAEANAGFTAGGIEPWLPVDPDYRLLNVERQKKERDSMVSLFRRLTAIRRSQSALTQGSFQSLPPSESDVLGYAREDGNECMLVVLNFGGEKSIAAMQDTGRILLTTRLDREGERINLQQVHLRAHEGVMLKRC